MTCSACSGAVEATLGSLTGVASAAVSLLTNTAEARRRRPARPPTAVCSAGRPAALLPCLRSRRPHLQARRRQARTAQVAFDSSVVQPQAFLDAVEDLGYAARLRSVRAPGPQLLTARMQVPLCRTPRRAPPLSCASLRLPSTLPVAPRWAACCRRRAGLQRAGTDTG
jgi:copper chaperone CopZ